MKKLLFLTLFFTSISFGVFAQTVADTTLHGTLISKAPDATSVNYQWTQISGPSCTILSPTSLQTDIKLLSAGVYVFQLVGTDNFGIASLPKRVTVTVNRNSIAPVVDAGQDFIIKLGSR